MQFFYKWENKRERERATNMQSADIIINMISLNLMLMVNHKNDATPPNQELTYIQLHLFSFFVVFRVVTCLGKCLTYFEEVSNVIPVLNNHEEKELPLVVGRE